VAVLARGERVVPDVTGLQGAEAVRAVRECGFVAAIESVVTDAAREGTVIEQDPPAGTSLEREGVLTLCLAALPEAMEPVMAQVSGGVRAVPELEGQGVEDDTETWFAALAGTERESMPEQQPAGRRHRKHRYPRPPVSEMVFDAPPPPPPPPPCPASGSAGVPTPSVSGTFRPHVGLSLRAAALSAVARLVSWPRVGALVAGVLCLLIGMRVFGSSAPSARGMNSRTAASSASATAMARRRIVRVYGRRHVTRALRKPVAHRAELRAASLPARAPPRVPQAPPAATAESQGPATKVVVPAGTAPSATTNQFAYLGR
jgi:hypothetical protein